MLWSISSKFWADPGADDTMFCKNCESKFYSLCQMIFILLWGWWRQRGVLKLKRNAQIWVFLVVCIFSPIFWAQQGVAYLRISGYNKTVIYNWVPNGFYFVLWLMSVDRSGQTYEKCSNLIDFSRFGPFSNFLAWLRRDLY